MQGVIARIMLTAAPVRHIFSVRNMSRADCAETGDAGMPRSADLSITRHMIAGLALVVLVAGGVGGWAASTEIAGALVAQGSVVVASHVKAVQHPTGGVVGRVDAHDGDRVREGDVLVHLDDTATRAGLAIIVNGLAELAARKARLIAERDGQADIEFPAELLARGADPYAANAMANERRLFAFRRTARTGQKAQFRERIGQLKNEVAGLEAQRAAKDREIELIRNELSGVRELWKKSLVPLTRVNALDRDAARLEGERGQLMAAVEQANGKTTETELQIIQIDRDLASEVAKDMREADAKEGELLERKIAAEDQLKRIDIRAPQDGVIMQSKIHAPGAVVSPADEIMTVVPETDALAVEARINPQDIEQVRPGQRAMLRFSAFNLRSTPEIEGKVARVSADATTEPRTGQTYYLVRIDITSGETAKLGKLKIVPGMPVEVFMRTEERTVISYLTKPLTDQLERTFREK